MGEGEGEGMDEREGVEGGTEGRWEEREGQGLRGKGEGKRLIRKREGDGKGDGK